MHTHILLLLLFFPFFPRRYTPLFFSLPIHSRSFAQRSTVSTAPAPVGGLSSGRTAALSVKTVYTGFDIIRDSRRYKFSHPTQHRRHAAVLAPYIISYRKHFFLTFICRVFFFFFPVRENNNKIYILLRFACSPRA